MRLYVMRHGPAEDRAPSGRDFDRALIPAQRGVVDQAARALCAVRDPSTLGAGPIRVLASPFRRARETAEIVAGALSLHAPARVEVELHDDLAADEPLPLDLVRTLADAGTDALLVGHQPAVEELVRWLAAPARVALPGGFRTAFIVALERVAPDRWHAAAVVDPSPAEG